MLVSHNLRHHGMEFPDGTVMRINLAWINDLETLDHIVAGISNEVFIDIPTGRLKPPSNRYRLEDIAPFIKKHSHIRYIAISNVEGPEPILQFREALGSEIVLVPKIETMAGIDNLAEIHRALTADATMMLDHDDLFNDVMTNDGQVQTFIDQVNALVSFCQRQGIRLLRTRGVIFSDHV